MKQNTKLNAYQMDFADLLEELQTSENWISKKEAKQRNELYWPMQFNQRIKILL